MYMTHTHIQYADMSAHTQAHKRGIMSHGLMSRGWKEVQTAGNRRRKAGQAE